MYVGQARSLSYAPTFTVPTFLPTREVPVTQSVRWSSKIVAARPDPSFLTHLIATADQAPQTRNMRRGSVEDAQRADARPEIAWPDPETRPRF